MRLTIWESHFNLFKFTKITLSDYLTSINFFVSVNVCELLFV